MSAATTDALVARAFAFGANHITFGFQGGEPTLAGLYFFEYFTAQARFAESSAKRNGRNVHVQFALQTNGVELNAEWARFFKRENFLIGVSIDGPRIIHDMFRVRSNGLGTHSDVMNGIAVLREQGVPVNALCVVDANTADNAELVYRYLRSHGFDWIQFIPCIDPLDDEPGHKTWSLSPFAFENFLKTTFDLRYSEWRGGRGIHLRWFDNLVGMAAGERPESCGMSGVCGVNFTIEADGSVYPCDFYVTDEWRLGNLHEDSFLAMKDGKTAQRFVESSRIIDSECVSCFAYPLCRGGCRRDREPFRDGRPILNRYCHAFKEFFSYAGDRIIEMATNSLR